MTDYLRCSFTQTPAHFNYYEVRFQASFSAGQPICVVSDSELLRVTNSSGLVRIEIVQEKTNSALVRIRTIAQPFNPRYQVSKREIISV